MSASDLFFSSKPAFPWSLDAVGWPLFAVAAVLLVLFTLWTYRGHPAANRRRLLLVLTLRLLALLVALLTAVRPTVGVQEKPKIPSHLFLGIDLSESMTIRDEFGGLPRIDAVRKILKKCQSTLDELRDDQNCEVILYRVGSPEFAEATGLYDTASPADGKKSDYGKYLAGTLQRWQGERFIRGHLVIGDGADNGTTLSAIDHAAKWRTTAPLHTFAVGSQETPSDRKDVGFAQVTLDPDPVAVKNKVTLRARVNAFGMAGIKVPVKVQFDTDGKGYKDVTTAEATLAKANDNAVEIPDIQAPLELPLDENKQPRRQIKVRVEIPVDRCPGDTNATNNVVETYLNLNKEGLRVLVVDRLVYESSFRLDALTSDKRIDVRKVDLQTDEGGEGLKDAFDFDKQAYDVLILGNIPPKRLTSIDPQLPEKIARRVKEFGMGLLMTGGHATLAGTPDGEPEARNGWRGVRVIEEILPVKLTAPRSQEQASTRYQVIPDARQQEMYLTKIGGTAAESLQLWDRLNRPFQISGRNTSARFTSLNRFRPEDVIDGIGKVYLWATDANPPVDLTTTPATALQYPLLIGTQFDTGAKGRVLVFAAQDSEKWRVLGLPKNTDGLQLHSRFWRQLVLWLAKQDEEDAAVWVRPEYPRLAAGAKQNLRFGMKGPNGVAVENPRFEVRVIAPGATADGSPPLPRTIGSAGEPLAEYTPRASGEYIVKLTATGTAAGKDVTGEATARFIVYPETSDELQRAAADFDFLQKLATTGGGKFHRLEDLPAFLNEVKNTPLDTIKPRPKYLPDWRRNYSKGFLPAWLVMFAALLLTEWGLRRWWGMV